MKKHNLKPRPAQRLAVTGELWLAVLLSLSNTINTFGALAAAPIPFYCRINEVQCPSGIKTCISSLDLCNGIKNCPDNSDENPAICKPYKCDISFPKPNATVEEKYLLTRKCPSGNMCTKKPVFRNTEEEPFLVFYRCTGGPKECADGSDEDPKYCKNLDCENLDPLYGSYHTTCPSKKYCVYSDDYRGGTLGVDVLCDGVKDCPDGSDEWLSFCKKRSCSFPANDNFRCKDGGCVRPENVCDGIKNCADGSDEAPSFCRAYECPRNGTKCPDGRVCLPLGAICDGKKNCPDGSDEAPARCRTYTCPSGQWKCKDGLQCVGKVSFGGFPERSPQCDSKFDCKDKSDESAAVCKTFNCGPYRTLCPSKRGCIDTRDLCDGIPNCVDGSDEGKAFCAKFKCTTDRSLKCTKNNRCVNGILCDGIVQCDDKTDEDPAFCQKHKCLVNYSKCPNFPYQCVPNFKICDGERDCINGGDEMNCPTR